ncbi:MAG: hypothetical protein WCC26_08575 [Terracidiphilus sp.]
MSATPHFSILCVGEDIALLETRAALLLAATGADVRWSATRDAVATIEQGSFDMVVLCHSAGSEEAQRIYEAAHRRGTQAQVLRLTAFWDGGASRATTSFDATTSVEPKALIRAATALLRERAEDAAKQEGVHR